MKNDKPSPNPAMKFAYSTVRRRDMPRQVPPTAKYSVIPSGKGYTSYRTPFLDDEE